MSNKTTWDEIHNLQGRLNHFLSEYATKSLTPWQFKEYFEEFKQTLLDIESDNTIRHKKTVIFNGKGICHLFITNDECEDKILSVDLIGNDRYMEIEVEDDRNSWRVTFKINQN